ncbi:hypothetical protein PXK01_02215 [Phaeobacter sp. PT47_59]|uniref:hypothetical protein n=1 Tax=Phaeobacter sp. PT47_59 TaxID=3029979 RepID=UPI0023803D83|nr:hypothetical protein [Phaeobacter sp. PT47_59]MDE4172947.1 hypothetical protein [Phaeobacter sp. PT47_59]
MKQKMLDQMAAVTAAQYLREHARIKPVLDEEARLRGQLNKLKAQVQETRAQAEDSHAMKALGADLLWEGWHTRTRRQLNTELAQATAKKLVAMDKLRKSFGRKTAIQDMAKAERDRTKAARIKALQERLLY